MRTIKASLKVNKNGKLYCTIHNTYKVIKPPKTDCKICWTLFNNLNKQAVIEALVTDVLDKAGH